MKKALLLFAALLVAGCGEKSSSEGLESASEKPATEPSADTAKPPPAESPVAESPSEEPSETPNSLSYADVERLAKEAVEFDSLMRARFADIYYQVKESEPYSGWIKEMWDSGQVKMLGKLKDGKPDGLVTLWYENGQKKQGRTTKDGKPDGLGTMWHENGQKMNESTYKDGELISEKWWNAKGEEVETEEEAWK